MALVLHPLVNVLSLRYGALRYGTRLYGNVSVNTPTMTAKLPLYKMDLSLNSKNGFTDKAFLVNINIPL